jgi:hypothetical protein
MERFKDGKGGEKFSELKSEKGSRIVQPMLGEKAKKKP